MCAVYIVEQNVKVSSSCVYHRLYFTHKLKNPIIKPHRKISKERAANYSSGFWRHSSPTLLVGLGLGVGEGLGLGVELWLGNQIAISTRGVIIWQGVENGHNLCTGILGRCLCSLIQGGPNTMKRYRLHPKTEKCCFRGSIPRQEGIKARPNPKLAKPIKLNH